MSYHQNDNISTNSSNLNGSNLLDQQKNDIPEVGQRRSRDVYRLKTDWLVSSVAWSNEPGDTFTLAIGSYIEDYKNCVSIARLAVEDEDISAISSFDHPYPATKVLWCPRPPTKTNTRLPRLLATSADYLRLWRLEENHQNYHDNNNGGNLIDDSSSQEGRLECLLNPNKESRNCAPLTSFDWNDIDPSIIITSSVDTTCAVWDIETCQMVDSAQLRDKVIYNLRNQIVAHNHEVYDVAFTRLGSGRDVFVSVGGDGSCRLFDLRNLSTSTTLYQITSRRVPGDKKALVRVCCNKQDPNYVSTFRTNSKDVIIFDIRQPGIPLLILDCHKADVNSMSWAPHSAHHLCTASNDKQALIWDLSKLPAPIKEPSLAYQSKGKINAISWSAAHSDWIAIGYENFMELLRV